MVFMLLRTTDDKLKEKKLFSGQLKLVLWDYGKKR